MAARAATAGSAPQEPALIVTPPTADHDTGRGRRRSRSTNRGDIRSLRTEESSTLRGRSPRRATSPFDLVSRSSSPTGQILRCSQLRHARREHCPSRVASPSDRHTAFRSRPTPQSSTRTRSRSRGLRVERDLHRSADLLSSLRNELRLLPGNSSVDKTKD
ncbi:hypothetical protein HRG_002028 [Hirsutella rhossiliensis]|uniref:Uncharacterized protein n=1 Tax=Hirsutella rhossiliensis TaxID=111463 RepID=A0A9P8SLT7_9HYPO|nr:uncharacterized protein HRG_02028 [Hirsutella rhossiliensis]KAH0966619.1 hypothetical protein HRG_02028 [Hirsutella rhossiliensis]